MLFIFSRGGLLLLSWSMGGAHIICWRFCCCV
jgi:hypothetical protein